MTAQILAALVAALVCILLLWILRHLMLSPVKCGKNTLQMIFLSVSGREPALENNLRSLLWLNDNGVLRCRIVILGNQLDSDTQFIARCFQREHSCITFIENGEMPEWIKRTN